MATITRPTKTATGTGSYGANSVLKSSELNGDIDVCVNEINGNLDNTNVKGAAAIEQSKIDGFSDSATEQDTQKGVGDYTSRTLAGTLAEEIQQLRFKIAELSGLVTNDAAGSEAYAQHSNATGLHDMSWIDGPPIGANAVANGNFTCDLNGDQTPDWWALVNGAETVVLTVQDGFGRFADVTAGSAGHGIKHTIFGNPGNLRASTKYLIRYTLEIVSGSVAFTTTGADSATEWRNISTTETVAAIYERAYVVITNAGPTDLVLQWAASGGAAQFYVSNVSAHEIGANSRTPTPTHRIREDLTSTLTAVASGAGYTAITAFSITDSGPRGGGHYARVYAEVKAAHTGAGAVLDTFSVKITQGGSDMGDPIQCTWGTTGVTTQSTSLTRMSVLPGTDSSLTWAVLVNHDSALSIDFTGMVLRVEFIPAGIGA